MCSRIQKLTVVLASASPRRTELLEQGNIKHVVMPSHCEEVITSQVPSQVVEELSAQKAEDVYQQYEKKNAGDFLVIGSDTVVAADGKILGKPKDKEEAYQMISMLQGKAHQVYTGVTLLIKKDGKKIQKTFHECSDVHVYPMCKEEIREYIATGARRRSPATSRPESPWTRQEPTGSRVHLACISVGLKAIIIRSWVFLLREFIRK